MRHLAQGGGVLRDFNELRGPMASVLDYFVQQKQELERYRELYGRLADLGDGSESAAAGAATADDDDAPDDDEDEEEKEEEREEEEDDEKLEMPRQGQRRAAGDKRRGKT